MSRTDRLSPQARAKLAVFVVSARPQSGKTKVGEVIAQALGVDLAISSAVVNTRIEAEFGFPAGTIALVRAVRPEYFRPDLIATANAMAAAGESPGLLCVRAGARVIDGMRRVSEVKESAKEARARGLVPVVIFVERPDNDSRVNDNTESDGLRAIADAVVLNDAGLSELPARALSTLYCLAASRF